MYKKTIIWVIKGCAFLIPFIPLYVSRSLFFPYITGKAFVFRIAVEIVFFSWVFLAVFYKEYRPKLSPFVLAISAWIFIIILATIFSTNPLRAFWSNFERMEGLITYLHLAAYFLVLTHVFRKSDWFLLFNIFLVSGLFENIYALLQKLGYLASPQGGMNRADGTIGNPTYLAAYLIFILAFSLFLLLESKNKTMKWVYGAMSFFTLITIYFTATRGATLALLGGFVIASLGYIFFVPNKLPNISLYKKIISTVLLFVIIVVSLLWGLRDTKFISQNPILSRLTSLSLKERTITSRFTIWSMSLEGVQEHPILGWGPENYNIVFAKYYKPELWRQEPWFDRSHNIIFDWLINGGILGLVAYFSMLAATLYSLIRSYKRHILTFQTSLLLGVTLFVYLFQNLFVFDNIATYISLFVVYAFINSLVNEDNKPAAGKDAQSISIRMYQPFFLLITILVAGCVIYFINIKPLRANLDLLEALKVQGSDPQQAYGYYDKVLTGEYLGRSEAREQFLQYAMSVGGSNIDASFKDKVLRRAEQEAEANVTENPFDPRAELFLGALYSRLTSPDSSIQSQVTDKALGAFNNALKMSPKKQQIYFEIADIYLKKGDYANAIHTSKEAYDLDPSFNNAQMNLVASYILNNQQDEADKILIRHYGTVDVADNILVQVYSKFIDSYRQQKDTVRTAYYADRLIRVWQAFIVQDPNNVEYRKRLVIVYLVLGQQLEAQRVLNEAVIQHPEFKADLEAFVKQIQSGSFKQ